MRMNVKIEDNGHPSPRPVFRGTTQGMADVMQEIGMQHAHVTTGQFQRRYDIRDREQGAEHRHWPVVDDGLSQGLRVPEVVHFVLQRRVKR